MVLGRMLSGLLLLFAGSAGSLAVMGAPDQGTAHDRELVAQKITLLDSLVVRAKASERFVAADNQEARALVAEAEELAGIAREKLKKGDLDAAARGLDEAFQRVFVASRMCKATGPTPVAKTRYQELLDGIASLRAGADTGVHREASRLIEDARGRAEQDDYAGAINLLGQAYEMVASAVATSRDNETVVYSLDFATAEDEYEYEVRRYSGNRMIIDLLLEKHTGSTAALVKNFIAQAEEMRQTAEARAAAGRFEDAVRHMEGAGQHQQRAMGLLGIQS